MNNDALDRYITGNYGEDQFDVAWERATEEIDGLAVTCGLEPQEMVAVFKIGLDAYQKAEELIQQRALERMKEDELEREQEEHDGE